MTVLGSPKKNGNTAGALAMFEQLIRGEPFGSEPMSNRMLLGFGVFYMLLGALLLFLYFFGRLITEVRPDGVHVRWFPFHRSFIHFPVQSLERYEAITYRPIRDFGGWGIRHRGGSKAYNVSGNRGVDLEFTDGKRLMIGSKKPEQMAQAIASIAR